MFDRGGRRLAVGDTGTVCILQVPSLALVKRTASFRPPEDAGTNQVIRTLVFHGDDRALLGSTEDTRGVLFDVATGAARWSARGCWLFAGASGEPARFLCSEDPGPASGRIYDAVTVAPDLEITEARWTQPDLDALGARQWQASHSPRLRAVLERFAGTMCEVDGRFLVPKEACTPR